MVRDSSSDSFIQAVKPDVAVISCGENNSYGHPHKEVLEKMRNFKVNVFRTDLDGAVKIETDGFSYWCPTKRRKSKDGGR